MKILHLTPLAVIAMSLGLAATASAVSPTVGDKAPLVEGKDQDGKPWKLAEAIGKKYVLLYFYPKDDTPGCTREACGLRDQMESLAKDNVEVVGVSMDSADSHQKFVAKYNLNFRLLPDTDGTITDAYGARMTGRDMARRVSFLIGLNGRILHVTDNMDAAVQLNDLKAAVEKLPKQPAPGAR